MVEWRSPRGNLIQFEDSGEAAVNSTRVTLSPLIPGTSYSIKVSADTPRGRGEEISTTGAVLNSASQGIYRPTSRLAMCSEGKICDVFTMQIVWPTFNCDFHRLLTATTIW